MSHIYGHEPKKGDTVVGVLPIAMIARLQAASVCCISVELSIPAHLRGKELSATEFNQLKPTLKIYHIADVVEL